jgi:hypothetical protein
MSVQRDDPALAAMLSVLGSGGTLTLARQCLAAVPRGLAASDLLGLTELADLYEVHRGTAWYWRSQGRLIDPIRELACGPIWDRRQVEQHG